MSEVRDALASLYDLPYLQSHSLVGLLPRQPNANPERLAKTLQQHLVDSINRLRPDSGDVATDERAARRYEILRLRYLEGIDPPTIWRQLGLAKASYYRQLRQGLETIATHLESELLSGSEPTALLMSPGYQTPLVGREEELGWLKAAYTAAASGDGGRFVMITGEQGVGKTRLAQELGHWVRLHGGLFLEGRWAAWEGAAPYGAVAESLRRGLRQLDPEEVALLVGPYSRDLARLFPDVVEHFDAGADATQLSLEEQQLRLYEGVGTVVYNLSQKQPLVMFLDDLHLAPHLGLQLHIARRLKESRLLIVDAYREDELVERPALVAGRNELIRSRLVTEVRLAPLTEAETGRMIAYAFGDAASAQLQAPTYAINRGNPFFVEEMLRYLIENKAVRRVQDRWEVLEVTRVGIPESVKLLVQERVARLGDEALSVLEQASVLGNDFSFAALSAMTDLPEDRLAAVLDPAMASGLLTDRTGSATREQYGFSESHFGDVLYGAIPAARRRRYHRQAGKALEALSPDRLEELAYHFTHGSDAKLGANYSYRAAERASSLFTWSRAIPLYRDALELWEELGGHLEQRAAAAESLGNACYKSGIEAQNAHAYLRDALSTYQELGNERKAATMHSQLGREHMHSGNLRIQNLASALEEFGRARDILEREPEDVPHGMVYCGLAMAHLDRLDLTDAVSWARRALELGERLNAPAVMANACAPLGSVHALNDVGQATEVLEQGWRTSDEGKLGFQADLSRACAARAVGVALKDPLPGLEWIERGPDYGTTYSLFDIPAHLIALHTLTGRFDEASRVLEGLQSRIRVLGQPTFGMWPDEVGLLWLRKGDWNLAEAELSEALSRAVQSGNRMIEASTAQRLGEVLLAMERHADAERLFLRSLDLARQSGSALSQLAVLPHLCEVYCVTGRLKDAGDASELAVTIADQVGQSGALEGDLRLAEGLVQASSGHAENVEVGFRRAIDVYRDHHLPWDEARAYYEWAVALKRDVNNGSGTGAAADLLRKALSLWEPMGAVKHAERCRGQLG